MGVTDLLVSPRGFRQALAMVAVKYLRCWDCRPGLERVRDSKIGTGPAKCAFLNTLGF